MLSNHRRCDQKEEQTDDVGLQHAIIIIAHRRHRFYVAGAAYHEQINRLSNGGPAEKYAEQNGGENGEY
jgi:hypothetical protein